MLETNKISRRLIAVSNRTAHGEESKVGGLAVALWDALESTKGLWLGWSGTIYDYPTSRFKAQTQDGVSFALCDFSKEEYEGFYLGYANSVLWPVLHGRVDLAKFDSSYFATYVAINQRFAEGVREQLNADDIVWVHDYHFLLVGRFLKELGWKKPSGFFLHVPFPGPDTFKSIPEHHQLAEGLTAYDVIGLQSERDVDNLKMYLERELDAVRVDDTHLKIGDSTVKILHCPIGIDADGFSQTALSEDALEASKKLSTFTLDRDLVIGVDRMDYSKGLPQRFEGMARFFDDYPELHGRVSYTQIAPPSRSVVDEYVQLRARLDALAGRINGDYGDLDWIPVRYLARGYPREEVAGLYRLARVCLVTPLQDGMNLVAKEFVAAQNPDDPGVLVLSQFAGASEQMPDALIVNPHNADDIAQAVHTALQMPLAERKRRWQNLFEGVTKEDIGWWRERFLSALASVEYQ